MATFHELSTGQLRQALQLREQIESLQQKLSAILGGKSAAPAETKGGKGRQAGKRLISAEARAKMAAGQQARWAKAKGTALPAKAAAKATPKKAGGITKAGRAKLSAAMKARWAAKKGASAPDATAAK